MEKMVKQVQNPMHVYRQKKREMKAIRQHNEHFFRILKTIGVTVVLWRVLAETKDFSERGFEKGFSVSRKVEKELLASAIASAAMMRALTKGRPLDAVGISKQLAKSASSEYKGLSEVLGTPLRVNESVYSQTTRSEHWRGRGNKAIVTRHACVISGTKGDGVLSFLCVENGSGGVMSVVSTKISSASGRSNVDVEDDIGDAPSSSPKSIPQILTSEQVAAHTSTAVKSVGGFFRRTLLENDTSAVTVARIDVFPNDDDVEEEERDDETTTSCKKYTPALTTYLKGTERLDGEDLALHHARESVRRFGLGRRTVASVIDFTKKTSDDDSSSSSAAAAFRKVSSNEDLKTCISLADAKATEVKFSENAVIRKEKREVRKEKLKKVGRSLKSLPY